MTKELKLACNCCGGAITCGRLKVIDFGDGSFEFNIIRPKQSGEHLGVYLEKKDLNKLKKFINL